MTGPAGGARLANVGTRVLAGGTALALAPDERMLTSPSTRFPVYIDPGFTAVTATGGTQDTDVVQSGTNCTGPHYDDSSYSTMPVGYDNFLAGSCQTNDTDYALYQMAIPSGTFGPHAVLISASFQDPEVYSSSCTANPSMTVSWIGPIGSGTGWPGPGLTSGNVNYSHTVGPDPGSCDGTEDTGDTFPTGFNIKPDLAQISSASDITLRLWEPNDTNDADHKQFSKNPDLQVVYTDTPNTPTGEEEASTNAGANSLDCDTSPANPPIIGKTDSTNGPYLLATYSDSDGAAVQANIRYWNYTTSSAATTVTKAVDNLTASIKAAWQMPASYTSGLPNGTVIAWQAQAETGSASVGGATYGPYSSAWSNTCYFAVYPQAPDPPTVTANFTAANPQSNVAFTIAQTNDPATEFVWSMDQTPPTAATAWNWQTCTTTSAEPQCTQISGGKATLTIPVTAPGPHDLFVYQTDAAGNESQPFNLVFTVAGDPNAAYTSGGSLQANFTAALGAGQPWDNTIISTTAGSPGTANGDGGDTAFDEAQLTAAGWQPGKTMTVDGATFALPDFGTSASGPDNLLSANQTIGAGPGAQGSALVFLATSTDADDVTVPGTATGSPDSGVLSGDTTAPAVMGGTPVAGADCDGEAAFNSNVPCAPASGTINYNPGCPTAGTNNQSPYTLTVPDWIKGPSDIAALVLPDRDTSTGCSRRTRRSTRSPCQWILPAPWRP